MSGALVIALGAIVLSGCSLIEQYPSDPDSGATLTGLQQKYFGPSSEEDYDKTTDITARRSKRDEIVYGRVHAYDIEFSKFQRTLYSAGTGISVGTDLTALILNGLGATTGGAGTKAALSAASGGVIGAQGVVNKDLFYQQTVPALIAQMEANRTKVKLAIFSGLKQPDADYPLKRADSDLSDLNDAGSLPNAINNITQQSTDDKKTSQAKIEALQKLTFVSTDSATKLQGWLYPNGNVDQVHLDALQKWLDRQPEPFLKGKGYPPGAFVLGDISSSGDLEPIRQRALNDKTLGIPQ